MSDPRWRGLTKSDWHKPTGPDPVQQLNDTYRLLKQLGWQCRNAEVHITDRVPLFRLGDASIRRNKQKPGEWIVEINGHVFDAGGKLEEITAQVRQMVGVSKPEPFFWEGTIPATAFGGER